MSRAENQPESDELGRRLRELPMVPAPTALSRDVMAVIQRRQQLAWWRGPLMGWPTGARWAVQVAGGVLAVFLVWLGGEALQAAFALILDPVLAGLKPVVSGISSLAAVGWRLGGLAASRASWAVMACGAAVVLAVYASSLGLGAMFWRVVNARE